MRLSPHRRRGRRSPRLTRAELSRLPHPGCRCRLTGGLCPREWRSARRYRPRETSRPGTRPSSLQPTGSVTSPCPTYASTLSGAAAIVMLEGYGCCYVVAALNGRAPIVQRPRTPPFQGGNTGSNPVGGANTATLRCRCARSRGAVWSARRPVKPEVAGSNPVGTAPGRRFVLRPGALGRVAQLAERPPEKRKVTGSTPVPTTRETPAQRGFFLFSAQFCEPSSDHVARLSRGSCGQTSSASLTRVCDSVTRRVPDSGA